MVGGRLCKTAVFLAQILGYRHVIHQKNACNLLYLYIISQLLKIFQFLEIFILFNFFHFYFSAKDISLNI